MINQANLTLGKGVKTLLRDINYMLRYITYPWRTKTSSITFEEWMCFVFLMFTSFFKRGLVADFKAYLSISMKETNLTLKS